MTDNTAIVVTTIHAPCFLPGYLREVHECRLGHTVSFFIIPDRETPASVYEAAREAAERGFDVRCPDEAEQTGFVRRLGLPSDFIPWNSDNRRNVGYLMALDAGCDVLISIDDDNFCLPDSDFVRGHEVVGRNAADPVVSSSDGWFNICSLLKTDVPVETFPRGFPYFARGRERVVTSTRLARPPVVAVNAGLWLDDPDVDAVSRLALGPKITELAQQSVILGRDVWSPINTQNTALTRDAAAAYYYVRMGHAIEGLTIDRFGDILSGYLLQKCAKHLGEAVRFGTPAVNHKRTPHNLLKDLYHELAGIALVEEFVPWLIEKPLEGSAYPEAYACLADHIASAAPRFKGFLWDNGGRDFLLATAARMRLWLNAVEQII